MSSDSISAEKLYVVQQETQDASPQTQQPPSQASSISWKQWLQVLSTFIVFFNTWGFLLTCGVFQTYYEQDLLRDKSSSDISWISTTCAFILLSAGVVTGPLYDNGFYRPLIVAGSILQVFGIMMMSLSTQYYQLFLSQAICVGLGAGIAFTPSVAATAACFTNPATRAKIMGLVACGSSIGGIVYPLIFQALIRGIGFPWTVRTIGFIIFALYCLAYLDFASGPRKGAMIRRLYDKSAFTDVPFLFWFVAALFSAMAYYIPFLYLPLLTEIKTPNVDPNLAFDLLAILNGASGVGRILAGFIAARFGPSETISVASFLGSLLLFCWIAVDTVAGTIVWVVFWGMISGVLVALPGAIIPLFCPSLSVIGTRSGMYWVWVGIGMLIGSPIGGAIFDLNSKDTDWWKVNVFAGCSMLAAALCTVYPVLYLHRRKQRSKHG